MKTNKWIILLLLVFFQCTSGIIIDNEYDLSISPGNCFPETSDKYVYPIVPGMIEWQTANSDELLKFCQLPDDILKSISTPGLIDALIQAPLFTGFYLLSSNASALKWHGHYELFNSAKELFLRKDAGSALVAYYKFVCFNCIDQPFGAYGDYERIAGLECLFTKQQILDSMEHIKKKEAVAALLANYKKCPDNVNSIFPMAHIMFADKYDPIVKYSSDHAEEFQYILDGYFYSLDKQVDLIVSFAKKFVK